LLWKSVKCYDNTLLQPYSKRELELNSKKVDLEGDTTKNLSEFISFKARFQLQLLKFEFCQIKLGYLRAFGHVANYSLQERLFQTQILG